MSNIDQISLEKRVKPVDGYSDSSADRRLIDLRELWSIVYRDRKWIGVILATSVAAGAVATVLMTPQYSAVSSVQIDQEAKKVLGTEQADASASIQDAARFLKTQTDFIRSRNVAETVAKSLRLFDNPQFLDQMGEEKDVVETPYVSLKKANEAHVIEVLQDHLTVDLPSDSRIVTITFTSPDPSLSARVANAYSEAYIRANLERKFDSSAYAREFLRKQIEEAQARLSEAERDAVKYAQRTRIIDASSGNEQGNATRPSGRTLTTVSLLDLSAQASVATGKRIAAEARWRNFNQGPLLGQQDVLANDAIQRLLQQRAEVSASLKEEGQRRGAGYPTIVQAQARLDEITRQIDGIASSIRASIRGEYEIARKNEESLIGQVNSLRNVTFDEQNQSIQLSILRREADTFRQQYEYLLKRYNELSAEAGVQTNNISLVDAASVPTEPVSPRILINLVIALFGGIVLSVLAVFARRNFFDTIRLPSDLEQVSNLPVLGVIPRIEIEKDPLDELADLKSPLAEAYSSLRSTLELSSPEGFPRSMAFVSSVASEGKSLTCHAVATSLVRANRRVLVIDLDLRRPNQHNYLKLKNGQGVAEVLSGGLELQQVIQKTSMPNMDFVSAGAIPPNPTELLQPDKLRAILDSVASQYDSVLIDSAPVLGLADALLVGSAVDAVIYAVEADRNLSRSFASALNRILQANVNVVGFVFTKFDVKQSGYTDGYYSAYEYSYAKEK